MTAGLEPTCPLKVFMPSEFDGEINTKEKNHKSAREKLMRIRFKKFRTDTACVTPFQIPDFAFRRKPQSACAFTILILKK
jgi:hypothetical protein